MCAYTYMHANKEGETNWSYVAFNRLGYSVMIN